jgi:hypothetical protein
MSATNGSYPLPKQTKTPGNWSERGRAGWMRLQKQLPHGRLLCVLMLLVLVAHLAACATNSPPSQAAVNPAPPRLSQPLPQESYSESARKKLDAWLGRLTGTPRM